jgi:hypothetical protein
MKNQKTKMSKIKVISFLVLIAFTLTTIISFLPGTANAIGLVTITVKNPDPFSGNFSWFIYEKQPGEVIEDIATIKNVGKDPTEVNVYAVDASSNESGSFILGLPENNQKNLGIWTEVNKGPFILNPHQSIDIPFKIHIPKGVSPGQYTGGIIVENDSSKKSTGELFQGNLTSGSVSVKTRIGTRIYLTIPGEIHENIKLTDASVIKELNGNTRFYFTIENKGNMTYEPKVKVDIYDTLGNLYEIIEQPLGTSSPATVIKPSVKMKKRPLFGTYKADITLTYESQFRASQLHSAPLTDSKKITFWVMPWEIILISSLLIIIAAALLFKKRVARLNYLAISQNYTVDENDDLIKIGKATKTPWKKIAKYNNLKPPYIVKPGDQIQVPKNPPTQHDESLPK